MLSFNRGVRSFVLALLMWFGGQALFGQNLHSVVSVSSEEVAGGVALDHGESFTTELLLGPSWNLQGDGFPLGVTLKLRESFRFRNFFLEPAVVGELDLFEPDSQFLVLPSIGIDLGVPFHVGEQAFLFYLGYRFGYAYSEERYTGQVMAVQRYDKIQAFPLQIGILWRGKERR